jgi:Zn-dependent protease
MQNSYLLSVINQLSFDLPAFILVILLHEYINVLAARKLMANAEESPEKFKPLQHLDLFGTLLPISLIVSGYPIVFGWGRKADISFAESDKPKACEAIYALSGVMGNLLLCLLTGFFISSIPKSAWLFSFTSSPAGVFVYTFLFRIFAISLAVMLINLLPIPPFAGGRLLFSIFAKQLKPWQEKIQILSLLIVVTLILTGVAQWLFLVPYQAITELFCGAFTPYVLNPATFSQDFLSN